MLTADDIAKLASLNDWHVRLAVILRDAARLLDQGYILQSRHAQLEYNQGLLQMTICNSTEVEWIVGTDGIIIRQRNCPRRKRVQYCIPKGQLDQLPSLIASLGCTHEQEKLLSSKLSAAKYEAKLASQRGGPKKQHYVKKRYKTERQRVKRRH